MGCHYVTSVVLLWSLDQGSQICVHFMDSEIKIFLTIQSIGGFSFGLKDQEPIVLLKIHDGRPTV